jgi:hypothetical protein
MKKYLFLLFTGVSTIISAQETGKQWLDRMNDLYKSATSISMSFQADYYALSAQASPSTTMKGEVRYNGAGYYSDAMGQIVITNKNYTLLIDKKQKTITCLPGAHKTNEATTGQPDTTWADASKIKLLDNSGPSRRIEISGNDPFYEKTEITINANTHELEQVIFYYKKQDDGTTPKLVVKYANVRFNAGVSTADFSEKKYIQKKNGKLTVTPAFSAYKIIDLMEGPIPAEPHN